jgi:uncharacterized integral membrane protein
MTTLSFVFWVVVHSQSRGALDIRVLDDAVDVRIELSMQDIPELCDLQTDVVDDRVRACLMRAIGQGVHVSTDRRCAWGSIDVQQHGVDVHATSTLRCTRGASLTVDWGLFAATSLQHIAIARAAAGGAVFETMLSKQRTKWEFALPQGRTHVPVVGAVLLMVIGSVVVGVMVGVMVGAVWLVRRRGRSSHRRAGPNRF